MPAMRNYGTATLNYGTTMLNYGISLQISTKGEPNGLGGCGFGIFTARFTKDTTFALEYHVFAIFHFILQNATKTCKSTRFWWFTTWISKKCIQRSGIFTMRNYVTAMRNYGTAMPNYAIAMRNFANKSIKGLKIAR